MTLNASPRFTSLVYGLIRESRFQFQLRIASVSTDDIYNKCNYSRVKYARFRSVLKQSF